MKMIITIFKKILDIFFAAILGITFLDKEENYIYIISIIFIYTMIQYIKSSHMKSFLHMILHFIVIYLIYKNSKKKNNNYMITKKKK